MRKFLHNVYEFIRPDKPPRTPGLWILLIPLTVQRKTRRIFYDGPAIYNYPGRKMKGYRSPNLLIYIWLHSLAHTWFTTLGRIMFVLSGLFLFVGMFSIQMPAYILSFALLALFMIDFSVGWLLRPRLRIRRTHTTLAQVNCPVRVDYKLTNDHNSNAWDLIVDTLPLRHTEVSKGLVEIPSLRPEQTVEVDNEYIFTRRGQFDLPVPLISSSFPFGIWRWSARGLPTSSIHIYPAYTALETLDFPLGREGEQGRELLANAPSESNEFMGCREYRYGDSARMIHSPSWARCGFPVVKEFREEYLPHAALLIDNFCPKRDQWWRLPGNSQNQSLEALLNIAAAIADKLTRDNYLLDVFVPGWQSTHIRQTHGPDQLDAILEMTACVEPNCDDNFHAPQQERMARIEQLQNLMLVLLDWDNPRQVFVQELLERRVGVKIVIVNDHVTEVAGDNIHVLKPTDILAGNIINL